MNSYFPISRINQGKLNIFVDKLRHYYYINETFKQLNIDVLRRFPAELLSINYRLKSEIFPDALIKLFFLGEILSIKILKKIFSSQMITWLINIKLLKQYGQQIKARVMIIPFENYYFTSDFSLRINNNHLVILTKPRHTEPVYPLSKNSVDLWQSLINKSVDTVLDLGTGCGFHAILISSTAKKVTAVDINPRAINFASFNALLNKVKNVTFFKGNLYKPINRDKFDLILANPPYEISLKKRYLYEDGGPLGDKILKEIIEGLPNYLTDRGYCQIVTKIFLSRKVTKKQLSINWLNQAKYKVVFLEFWNSDIYKYAATSSFSFLTNIDEFEKKINQTISNLQKMRINNISYGILTLKKSSYFSFHEKRFIGFLPINSSPAKIIKSFYNNQ